MKGNACVKGNRKGSREGAGSVFMSHHIQSLKGAASGRQGLSAIPAQDLMLQLGPWSLMLPAAFSRRSFWAHPLSHHVADDKVSSVEDFLLYLLHQF